MKAIRIHEDGGPEVLRYEDVPDPEPAAGEVLVELRAASVNHLDIWVRMGLPSVPKPRILGADGAGVVAGLGDGVNGFAEGDRVVINPGIEHGARITVIGEHTDGTHCERIAVPAENVFPLDDSLSFEEAAAFPLVFLTAWRMLVTRARVRLGEDVLVWAAGSGVGMAAIQIAKLHGARVIATAGSDDKLQKARGLGADEVINHHGEDVVARVKALTGKRGVDVVIEHVGEATWERSILALAPGGRLVTCGATTGPNGKTELRYVFSKQLSLMGSYMGSKAELLLAAPHFFARRLRPVVHEVLPLAEARRAHEAMEASKHFGKLVLQV
jgi:NADPH:quinone reductase-like Zn-dependent oxidoreductase